MKIKLLIKQYLKEIITTLLLIIAITFYLKTPFKNIDVYKLNAEIIDKTLIELSKFTGENIDFSQGFNNSFYYALPLTQVIEYKKQLFIYNSSLINNNDEYTISEEMKKVLQNTNNLHGTKELLNDNSNTNYILIQILGVLSALSIFIILYLLIKYKKPGLKNYYFFVLILIYLTSFSFFMEKKDVEKLTQKTLKESYINNRLN